MAAKETPRCDFLDGMTDWLDDDAAHAELPVQRNGQPVTACDFCGAETNGKFCDPAGLYLEEGDLYACGTCWDRWMAEDARDAAAIARGEEPS